MRAQIIWLTFLIGVFALGFATGRGYVLASIGFLVLLLIDVFVAFDRNTEEES